VAVDSVPNGEMLGLPYKTPCHKWMAFLSETLLMPIPDASHATSKILKKIGDTHDMALTILFLISANAFEAALDQANSPFFRQSVIGAMIVLNP